ncbi:Aste57867_13969 [Aphanomyces stellatus]|uniref:Aste57867_13969 protein n=1 Tax=Aphanomyces stellatus TaxID=120398 RepID=A0A485KZI2_9STRA|nr:hypothetical protein As57867_013918 [Aphanomyces stellatus]VFT90799.1 Aste57867_13969 [Aphanomyces stellatus]
MENGSPSLVESPTSTGTTQSTAAGTPQQAVHEPLSQFVAKKGRPINAIWSLFTNKPNAQMLSMGSKAPCKHCHNFVIHHNKTACVERHLKKCMPFLALMHGMPEQERPDWFNATQAPKKSIDAANLVFSIKKQQAGVLPKSPILPTTYLPVVAGASEPTIKLNVGGTFFESTRTTLLQHEHSFFHDLLLTARPRPDGSYFLDLDPKIFTHVMDFLRYGELSVEGLNSWERRKLGKTMAFLKLEAHPWDPFSETAMAATGDGADKDTSVNV